MIHYEYYLCKDGKFKMQGRTTDKKYIDNLIKYKRRGKRYNLRVIKGTLIEENRRYKMIDTEILIKK